jgi:hypothetical protein
MIKNRIYAGAIIFVLVLNLPMQNIYSQDLRKDNILIEKEPGIKEYGLEFLGASIGQCVIGIPITIAGVIGLAYGFGDLGDGGAAAAVLGVGGGHVVGSTVGAPLGTMLTGKIMYQKGSRLGAWMGGLLGTGLGLSTIWMYDEATHNQQQNDWGIILLTSLVLPPLCSVGGYNLLGSKSTSQSFYDKNNPQFTFALKPEKYRNKISPKFGMNIICGF